MYHSNYPFNIVLHYLFTILEMLGLSDQVRTQAQKSALTYCSASMREK